MEVGEQLHLGPLKSVLGHSIFHCYYYGRRSSELAQWFHFLILEGGLLVILIDCMTFLSPFVYVTRMSMSTVFFLSQLESGILCL